MELDRQHHADAGATFDHHIIVGITGPSAEPVTKVWGMTLP